METQLNRVELIGTVGQKIVRTIGQTDMIRFTLSTLRSFNGNDSDIIVETTWHNVLAYQNENMPQLDSIERGNTIHLIGRIHHTRILKESSFQELTEVIAHSIEVLSENASIEQC